jgi:glucose-6-phosphate 1-dehydrogenase
MPSSSLNTSKSPAPCTLTIFGASGDLTQRKLAPALWYLNQQKLLPASFAVVGVARRNFDDESFRTHIKYTLEKFVKNIDETLLKNFLKKFYFLCGEPDDPNTYKKLKRRLNALDKQENTLGNRCFYCSVPPQIYMKIVKQLGDSGLHRENVEQQGWSRIIVEKPFGQDYQSAFNLNETLLKVFEEKQIYRIDHYLGKETVQNILVFRLANSIFEPLWNRRYIDHVQITAAEDVGVEHRASYYDSSGALRDMIQNHLLQILCVVAMEPPSTFDAHNVRLEKLKVLNAIQPFDLSKLNQYAIRGQYSPYQHEKTYLNGYLQEPDVPKESRTETFAALRFTIENWRWKGVPFYLRTGKRLPNRSSAITLQFHQPPHLIFKHGTNLPPSTLTVRIQPEEGISLSFNGKTPGPDIQLGNVGMDFSYKNTFGGRTPDAYETLLLDCLQGDSTLYADRQWIEKSWELLTPIINTWHSPNSGEIPQYPAKTWGPIESNKLMEKEWRKWAII